MDAGSSTDLGGVTSDIALTVAEAGFELYDLLRDPAETIDLNADEPESAEWCRRSWWTGVGRCGKAKRFLGIE